MQASEFSYHLPEASIAQSAIEPRDAARLLVASTLSSHRFSDLPQLLREGDLLVVNRTRVRAARLHAVRHGTGGTVEVLLTKRVDETRWEALLRPARRMRAGVVLQADGVRIELLSHPVNGVASVGLTAGGDIEQAISVAGEIPLPPYFRGQLDDDERYQTIFAETTGSAAAPTSALHFTPQLVSELSQGGIRIVAVDLDIGLDTFRPMADGEVTGHVIHREEYAVPAETAAAIDAARANRDRIVAVGTTVVRTLETAVAPDATMRAGAGESDLFIVPGFKPRIVDAMITNFHAPQTTLIVMIAALLGDRWRTVYDRALAEDYRFLSFGDAMFIDEFAR
ncbi:S-adenosylmethionine:tRNA ribosyltransferase-isomerase [bacterium BMS3Bbin02]|nr:S-adenosylmethionine:tRNA ribosyltransferase-isomerase [bacterium BMS3Bbin02]